MLTLGDSLLGPWVKPDPPIQLEPRPSSWSPAHSRLDQRDFRRARGLSALPPRTAVGLQGGEKAGLSQARNCSWRMRCVTQVSARAPALRGG